MINNSVFGKIMGNLGKHRDINKKNLVSELNYDETIFFSENSLTMEMKKIQIVLNELVYLRLSILEMNKIIMYKFRYDYLKAK